ncbi:MAG TPA: type III pantothenate kinase [Abditibacteriaceae bacterium]|jgi:type III pantothenate kinase
MLLVLDIGNTNITAGVFQGETLAAQWRLSTQRDRTVDEFAVWLAGAFSLRDIQFADISGVAISSVVPSLTPAAAQLARDFFGVNALIVNAETHTGLQNVYDAPRDVGADRLVNALAARTKFGGACLICDFGTATTVDAVTVDGRYLGGAIAPGIKISTNALFQAAARLPRVELEAPPHALGRNTRHSMQSGLVYGYAGLVKELIARCQPQLEAESGSTATVVATGGLAELIAPHVPAIQHVEPDLALHGLRLLWNKQHTDSP